MLDFLKNHLVAVLNILCLNYEKKRSITTKTIES